MWTPLLYLHTLMVIGFTMRILLRDDLLPPARLAWFIVLALFPFVGSAVYFLFGEVDFGNHARARHRVLFAQIRAKASSLVGSAANIDAAINPAYRPAFHYASSINGFYPIAGNRAELMADADAFRERLIADIDAATQHIHVMYYIWLEDDTGRMVAEALMRAAKRGVVCRAMADSLGSRALVKSELWQDMKRAGVQVAGAFPLDNIIRTLITSRVDLRNHRKITIIDGRITYCGSRNSADPEFLIKKRFAPWVDIMMRFEGPVVAQKAVLFASDWNTTTGEFIDIDPSLAAPFDTGFPAQVVGDGPTERRSVTPQLFATLAASAEQELVISTPYFVPDGTVLDALCATALRGVKVIMVFPKRNDSWIVAAASRSYYRRLLKAGVEIHEFRGGLLHAKTLTVDGLVTFIGSTNLDMRSFELNFENNILFEDAEQTAAVRERQQDYINAADHVSRNEVEAWPFYRRIWNNVVATVGPIL